MIKTIFTLLLLIIATTSCASLEARSSETDQQHAVNYPCVFPGVKNDFMKLTGENIHAHMDYLPIKIIVGTIGLIDLPLSLIVDTIAYPYDVFNNEENQTEKENKSEVEN